MTHDIFDTYKVIIEDTNALGNRRQTIDTVYESIVTLILGADGYLAAQLPYSSLFPLIAAVGTSIVGIVFTRHWRTVVERIKQVLQLRYSYLRQLEADPALALIHAQIYSNEEVEIYERRRGKSKRTPPNLQTIFTVVFVLIPLIRAILVTVVDFPAIHLYIVPLLSRLGK